MSKWIRWTQWDNGGMIGHGRIPIRDVDEDLLDFGVRAKEILAETGADHVVYGLKCYTENYELTEVKFYLLPMDDETFEKDVVPLRNCRVYAVHKM